MPQSHRVLHTPLLAASTALMVVAVLCLPQTADAWKPRSRTNVHVHLQVPFVGGHEPIGITSIGGDLGVRFWERWAIEAGLTYGTDLAGTGWTVGGAFGAYWTLYDGRNDDDVGAHFSVPTLLGVHYVDTDHDCRGPDCATRLWAIAPNISTGLSYVYWTKWGFGINLRILLTGGKGLIGGVEDVETGDEADLDGDNWYGSTGRLTWGISF